MAFIEANITIKLSDNVDPTDIVEQIRSILSSINDKDTDVNVIEVDNPVTINPMYNRG